jgi:hypothetical protein
MQIFRFIFFPFSKLFFFTWKVSEFNRVVRDLIAAEVEPRERLGMLKEPASYRRQEVQVLDAIVAEPEGGAHEAAEL